MASQGIEAVGGTSRARRSAYAPQSDVGEANGTQGADKSSQADFSKTMQDFEKMIMEIIKQIMSQMMNGGGSGGDASGGGGGGSPSGAGGVSPASGANKAAGGIPAAGGGQGAGGSPAAGGAGAGAGQKPTSGDASGGTGGGTGGGVGSGSPAGSPQKSSGASPSGDASKAAGSGAGSSGGGTTSKALLTEINRVRAEHGLSPLKESSALDDAASSNDAKNNSTGQLAHHNGLIDGSMGEITAGSPSGETAKQAVQQWLDSPEHRAIMLNPNYTEFGGSISGNYSTADFK